MEEIKQKLDPVEGAPSMENTGELLNSPTGAMADEQNLASYKDSQALGIPEMSPEEMKSDLKQKLASVESTRKSTKAKQISNEAEVEKVREEVMKSLFAVLEKRGVNLKDANSIRDFLAKLEIEDPDLYDVFEMIFNSITGEVGQSSEGMAIAAEMNGQNQNIPPTGGAGAAGTTPNTVETSPSMGEMPMPGNMTNLGAAPIGQEMPSMQPPTMPPSQPASPEDFKNLAGAIGA